MQVTVRRATVADADLLPSLNEDVQRLHAEAMPKRFKPVGAGSFSAAAARDMLAKPSNRIFIAEVEGQPAGYTYAEIIRQVETPLRHAWDEIHLHHISVRPAYRRHGVATALLDAVRAAGREAGIALITLQVWSFNEGSQAFFRSHGFTPYMVRLWNNGTGGSATE